MRSLSCLLALALFACDDGASQSPQGDTGPQPDAAGPGALDGSLPDHGPTDARMADRGPPPDARVGGDAAPVDAGPRPDGQAPDAAAPVDAAPPDAMVVDAAPPVPGFVLNEVNCRGEEGVELFLTDGAAASPAGFVVTDAPNNPLWGVVLGDEAVAPGGHVWVGELPFGVACDDTIYVLGPDRQVVDQVVVGEPRLGVTWGRLPDGAGAWGETAATPGATNRPAPPSLVAINEVDCWQRDFIELTNPGEIPVDLAGYQLTLDPLDPAGGWALDTALDPNEIKDVRQATELEAGFAFDVVCGAEQTVYLLDPAGEVVDSVAVPTLAAACSYGRLPDGVGAWACNQPTRDAPNAPLANLPADLFDPQNIFTVRMQIGPEQIAALNADPRTYVPATFSINDGEVLAVGVHLKGRIGSFRTLDRKSGFKVNLDFLVPGQRYLGLEKLTLNNIVQDRSMLHEWLAYTLFRGMGVPSPRTGYARVYVNDQLYGLYAHLETIDEHLLDRWLPPTVSMFEGAYGNDLFPDHVDRLQLDEGIEDRTALRTIVDLITAAPPEDFYELSAGLIDWPEVLAAMVTEIYTGHWDGYAPTRNNYYFHFDETGIMRLFPWGTDQTFDRQLGWHDGNGLLLQRCRASADCLFAFDMTLVELARLVDRLDLVPAVTQQAAIMRPWVEEDPRRAYSPQDVDNAVQATINFLQQRRQAVGSIVDCLLAEEPDPDHDGFACDTDCNPNDPLTHPGAREICGDGIDQDCNGVVDDGLDCPDCTETSRGGRRYLVCTTPRNYADAQAHCREQGADLAVLDDAPEATWLYTESQRVRGQDYYIGLNDRAQEGQFRWVNGSLPRSTRWSNGEPNDAGGNEDCAHLWGRDGTWNDLPCDRALGVLCEDVCDPATDADHDGSDGCGTDCNDNDPTVHPGAPDICLDGIDQDCNGVVDDGPNCLDCRVTMRGPHRYAVCLSRRNWQAARQECQAAGMDLAMLKTGSETRDMAEAARLLGPNFYFGLSDQAAEGTFRWIDGTEAVNGIWARGQPDDWQMNEDCVELTVNGAVWNDITCSNSRGFICEATCPPGQDTDGDGIGRCEGDCDDSNPAVGLCLP